MCVSIISDQLSILLTINAFDLRSPKIPQKGHKIEKLYGQLLCLS